MYNINWNTILTWLTPTDLRGQRVLKYLIAVTTPLKRIHSEFLAFVAATLYEINLNGQISKMERVLNDRFDPVQRRIYIDDGPRYEAANFFSFYLDKSFEFFSHDHDDVVSIYSYGLQGNEITFDFIVFVPLLLAFDEARMHSNIRKYKILGKTYDIQRI